MKTTRSKTDKSQLQPEMHLILLWLIAIHPASNAMLAG